MVACVVIPDISHSRNTALTGATAPLLLIAKFQNFRYLIRDKMEIGTFISKFPEKLQPDAVQTAHVAEIGGKV